MEKASLNSSFQRVFLRELQHVWDPYTKEDNSVFPPGYHPQLSEDFIWKDVFLLQHASPKSPTVTDHLSHRLPTLYITCQALLSFIAGLWFLDQRKRGTGVKGMPGLRSPILTRNCWLTSKCMPAHALTHHWGRTSFNRVGVEAAKVRVTQETLINSPGMRGIWELVKVKGPRRAVFFPGCLQPS